MRTRQNAVLAALQRAQRFIAENVAQLTSAVDRRGRAQAARRHRRELRDTLIERGLPADFLDQLNVAVAKLETSLRDQYKSRTVRMGATKALAFEEQEDRTILKVLDALAHRCRERMLLSGVARAVRARSNSASLESPWTFKEPAMDAYIWKGTRGGAAGCLHGAGVSVVDPIRRM